MRIAIYHNLPSGGGKRALYEMTRRLAHLHRIDTYTLSTSEQDFCDLRPFCNQHEVIFFRPLPLVKRPFGRLNQGIRTVNLLRLNFLQRQIASQIDSANYDVVFVHHCRYGQSPSLLQFLKTPSVYYCQEPPRLLYEPSAQRLYNKFSFAQKLGNLFDPLPNLYRRTLSQLDRANVRVVNRVLVNSYYSREALYRIYGIFAHVVYLGVDIEKFYPLELPKENFVLSVGALTSRKGFDFLLRSLAHIERANRPELVIISNKIIEHEKTFLIDLATELEITVSFREMITDDELVQLYNKAQLTVYAPVMEPFGFVPLESMACATPVVGICEAGVRESVKNKITGLLTERDPTEFASAIQGLLDNPKKQYAYGQQAHNHILENWTWNNSIAKLEYHLTQTALSF